MKNLDVFLIFLGVRLLSVLVVQTWFVPDEYWQSLEVAHGLTFGYGHFTWEWAHGLRSYIHPLIFAFFYKILQLTTLDYAEVLIYLPRILQAILSAYADLCFYNWSGTRKWAIFCMASSWFWFYTGSRTLLNTFETALTTIALSKFPWIGTNQNNGFICVVSLLCAIRPTAVIQWIPLCAYHLFITKENRLNLILKRYVFIGTSTLAISVLIDSLAHGSFVVTSYEFLKANVFKGVGEFYGSHPWYWYLSTGLPAILGIHIIPFIVATVHILQNRHVYPNELALLGSIVFTVFVYSLLPHKEFRFILPILPMVLSITSGYLSRWSCKAKQMIIWIVTGVLLTANLAPAWYLGVVHQRGSLDVMSVLRDIAKERPETSNFLFLMPCHSTPYYSHIHQNVTMRFLTCEPNLEDKEKYRDEAEDFYLNQPVWLRKHYPPNGTLPSHIIAFDVLTDYINDILSRYKPVHRIFYSSMQTSERVGKYIVVHERIDLN